jgi:hypothetical protein
MGVLLPSFASLIAFIATCVIETLVALACLRAVRGSGLKWCYAALEPLRAYLIFVCWLRACLSTKVSWRGHDFILREWSTIEPLEPGRWGRARAIAGA